MIQLAPLGYKGVQPDNYYIFTLIGTYRDRPRLFDEKQQKQWASYYEEIVNVMGLFQIPSKELDFSILFRQEKNLINVPWSIFMEATACSDTTFSAIISALNRLMPKLWEILLN